MTAGAVESLDEVHSMQPAKLMLGMQICSIF